MNLLVLGGTVFVGRHFVEAALARGHRVTLLHRGQRGADLFPQADRILADRDGGLDALGDRTWDAVVDCCGYVPRVVRQSAQALRDRTNRYLFVSTISVYKGSDQPGMTEDSELATIEDETVEEITGETYGALKVLCEQEVQSAYGDRALIVRPGLVIGPNDPTNRFTYWVDRLAKGGRVLLPNRPSQPMQLIDARDMGLWMVLALEQGLSGVYNANGQDETLTFGDMVAACHKLNLGAQLVWADPEFLAENSVELWQELPLVLPVDGSGDGMQQVDNSKARNAGLTFRSWEVSARDTLAWRQTVTDEATPRFGLDPDKEAAVLAKLP